jgi:hypothetical protein
VTRRPNSHVLEDRSRDRLATFFHDLGWTVESIKHDYGEDLLVRIFENGSATPLLFFIQAKASRLANRHIVRRGRYISVPVSAEHVRRWLELAEPVFVTFWDAVADVTYWESVHTAVVADSLGRRSDVSRQSRVWIPTFNVLERGAVGQIRARTEDRYMRYLRESYAARLLVAALKEIGVNIVYDPQRGVLQIPEGKFLQQPNVGPRVYPFGPFERDLHLLSQIYGGIPLEQALLNMIRSRRVSETPPLEPRSLTWLRGPLKQLFLEDLYSEDEVAKFLAHSVEISGEY